MAFAAFAPLAEMAGSMVLPEIEGLVGAETAKVLSPLAKSALSSLVSSKAIGKLPHKLGNLFFGKHHKTARHLIKKGSKVAGVLSSKQTHKLIKDGLNVGQAFGMLDANQANSILDTHKQAMSLHDQLSSFNKKYDPLSPKFDMRGVTSAASNALASSYGGKNMI